MFFYIVLMAGITLFGYLLCNKTQFKYRNGLFVALAFGFLCFLSCVRYDVGFDYSYGGYTGMWRQVHETPFSDFMSIESEKGFTLLLYFLKLFGQNYQIMYAGTSIVIAALAGWLIYKYAEDKVWGFFMIYGLGMFYCSMNFIRQTMSCLVFSYAIIAAKKKKIIPYMIITLLAASFHKSALLMIPMYFLMQVNLTNIILAIYTVISMTVFFSSPYILEIVTKIWYGEYIGSYHITTGNKLYYIITPLILFAVLYFFKDKLCKKDKTNMVYINCAFFNLFFYLISCHHRLVDRFTLFFEPAVILGICALMKILADEKKQPDISRAERSKAVKLQIKTGIITAAAVMVINMVYLIENGHGILPYQTIFTSDDFKIYSQTLKGYDNIIEEPVD